MACHPTRDIIASSGQTEDPTVRLWSDDAEAGEAEGAAADAKDGTAQAGRAAGDASAPSTTAEEAAKPDEGQAAEE